MGVPEWVLDKLYALWVEAQVHQWLLPGSWESEEAGISLVAAAKPASIEASSVTEPATLPEGLDVSVTVDGPTGYTPREGVASNQGTIQAADVEAQGAFDPSSFWLLL